MYKVYFFYRSSHRSCSIKKGVLKDLAKFTGKELCQNLFFNKVKTLLRKRPWHRYFSCKFCAIFRTTFFTEDLRKTASISFSTSCSVANLSIEKSSLRFGFKFSVSFQPCVQYVLGLPLSKITRKIVKCIS